MDEKKKAINSYRAYGINQQGYQDNQVVPAYSKKQAKWKVRYLHNFKFVSEAILIK